jgi:hypothetical protein
MSMTKKDFIALADQCRHLLADDGLVSAEAVRQVLIHFCYSQNPHFNELRWRKYLAGECGPNGGKVKGG